MGKIKYETDIFYSENSLNENCHPTNKNFPADDFKFFLSFQKFFFNDEPALPTDMLCLENLESHNRRLKN